MFGRKQRRKQDDFNAEVEAHIALEADRLKEQGLSDEEAQMAARRAFGNVTQAQERFYESSRWVWWDQLLQDLRFGLRQLRRNPGFTVVAVITLAIGIGANTAIFSVANAALLRPLPYKDTDRLVMLWSTKPREGWRGQASSLDFITWSQDSHSFASLAAIRPFDFTLTGRGEPARLFGGAISAGFFETLGIAPELGRTFTRAECRPGAGRVALISKGLWQDRFGSDPRIVGKSIRLNDEPFTIIGVMPDALQFPVEGLKVWIPLALKESQPDDRHNLFVVGRLKEKATVSEAQAGVTTIAARLEKEYPQSHAGYQAAVIPLRESFAGSVRPALGVLFGAVALVLLIACANVASLLLARSSERRRELGLRVALGATQWRLTRSMLVESVLLALPGGALGAALADWGVRVLLASVPADLPLPSYLRTIPVDSRVLAFTLVVSLVTGILFGVFPAIRASRVDPNTSLKEGDERTAGGLRQGRLRSTLVVAELALTMILLVGAGLLMQTAVRLQRTDPGLQPDHVLVMDFSLPAGRYREPQQKVVFCREILDRVRALPRVRRAGLVNDLPLRGWTSFNFTIEGRPAPSAGEVPEALEGVVSSGYFRTMGIPLLRGRTFNDNEGATSPPVAVVNQALAGRYFRGEDPIGHRIRPGGPGSSAPWYRIVGVVGNVRQSGVDATPRPEVYNLYAQEPWPEMTLVVRTESDPLSLVAAVKNQIWAVDPDQPVSGVARMTQVLSDSLWPSRILAYLEGTFALFALMMASVGLYGVISQSVNVRRHEFGVRLALGAEPGQILSLVIGHGLKLILVGLAIGTFGAVLLGRSLSTVLHQVSPTDPLTFIAVSLILIAVALLACYIPARRAAKVDPMVALRYE